MFDIITRMNYINKYSPKTSEGSMIRKLLVVQALTEIREDEDSKNISQGCVNIIEEYDEGIIGTVTLLKSGNELLDAYREIGNGIDF